MSMITLTTDFGTRDWFVGTMKGVIAGLAPEARLIDLTHEVPPGDIRGGAFALAAAAPFFGAGTIHVAVVDPGVGSRRRAIAIRSKEAVFVGPDNGVLSWALRDAQVEETRSLDNREWFLDPVSRTFHGRDIFAPVAARLAAGALFAEAGDPTDEYVRLPWPPVHRRENGLSGEILYVDRFGNAITNLPAAKLAPEALANGEVHLRCGALHIPLCRCYADAPVGSPVAVAGSGGLLELAINGGDFATHHGLAEGTPVEARW
ncbi:MAG: SAM-dependent chlorinase/fluorinase [Akkermansiaceae bacterium]|nr:SAM-dependent chlorinase/fluorinase [Akkermansiaceae bacterium]